MRRYWVQFRCKYARAVDAPNKREAILIARDEYDDENKQRDERGRRIVTPLYEFEASYVGPA